MASVVIDLPTQSSERATSIASRVVEGAGLPQTSIPFIAEVVSAYFSARDKESQDELFREKVCKLCTEEGVAKFDAACSRGGDVIVEDVIWALQEALTTPASAAKGKRQARKADPSNSVHHNVIRFQSYMKRESHWR